MSERMDGWRECADPVELAAAVAAGVEVLCVAVDGRTWETGCEDSESFRRCMANGCRYRVPASWSWSPEPPAPVTGDDLPPDGCEAVWLPTDVVDEWVGLPTTDYPPSLAQARATIYACREAQARRGTTPAPPPAPPWPDGVLRDAANRLRWIANSGYIEDPGIKRIIRSWADELDATPAPPWPGAVLSGCVDEDGVPTWLAQAGQVRGEQVRLMAGSEMWMTCSRGWSAIRWVEVRAPRAVPVPETERVPWWEANDRELVDGLLCVENAMIREVGREGDRVYVCGYEDPDNPDEDDRGDWQRNYWYGRDGFDGTVEVLVEAGQ